MSLLHSSAIEIACRAFGIGSRELHLNLHRRIGILTCRIVAARTRLGLRISRFGEPSEGQRSEIRSVTIRIRLLGAYHDGFIELYYPQVFRYSFDSFDITRGHRNWRYDEFRLSDNEHVIHEVEWRGPQPSATWVIEASDVQHQWIPKA